MGVCLCLYFLEMTVWEKSWGAGNLRRNPMEQEFSTESEGKSISGCIIELVTSMGSHQNWGLGERGRSIYSSTPTCNQLGHKPLLFSCIYESWAGTYGHLQQGIREALRQEVRKSRRSLRGGAFMLRERKPAVTCLSQPLELKVWECEVGLQMSDTERGSIMTEQYGHRDF